MFISPSNFWESKEPNHFEPKDRGSRGLPDFSNGGIIVFYHVYKTGGSTVGKLLHELARDDQSKHELPGGKPLLSFADSMKSSARLFFTMIRKRVDWKKDCMATLDLAEQKKLILLELHVEYPTSDFPTLVELVPILDRWRREAGKRGVGFFAFTLLREPVAHALSFFNFFHVGSKTDQPVPTPEDHDYWNPFRPLQSTQANFLHSYYAKNRQCQMLTSDPQSTKGAPLDIVWDQTQRSKADITQLNSPCRVDKVYDAYFNSLDWVGTTENLQNETLPLLTKIVSDDPSIGRYRVPFKVFNNNPTGSVGMKKSDLSKKSLATILERTELDRTLYADVTRNFRLKDLGWDYKSPLDGK